MKKKGKKCVVLALALAVVFLVGCKSPGVRQAVFDVSILLSGAVMQGYVVVATEKCKGDTNCLANVSRNYAVYTNALNAALKAHADYERWGTNRSEVYKLVSSLTAAQADVTRAVLEATK